MKNLIVFCLLVLPAMSFAQGPDNINLKLEHGPYLQRLGPNAVTVMWHTNKSAVPELILEGSDGEFISVRNSTDGIIDGGGLMHKVRVEGLEPGKTYNYRIRSTEILRYQAYRIYYGDTLTGRKQSFTTPDPSKEITRAIVFNDIHERSNLIGEFLSKTEIENPDMVFFNGDMIDYMQDKNQVFDGFLDSSVFYFAGEIPFCFVRGNHETRGMLARDFKSLFDFDSDRFYYAFTNGPVHFIVLDCGEDKPDNNRYYYGLADYDSYRLKELEWLKEHVKSDEFRKARYRVVLTHMPVIRSDRAGHGMQFMAENFGPVLRKAGIDLMIAGHTHRVAFLTGDESGFSYPVVVSSNNTFTELDASKNTLSITVRDAEGKPVLTQQFPYSR